MSEANRHTQSKDPYHVQSSGGLERSFHLRIRLQTNMAAYVQTGRRRDAAELRSAGGRRRPPLRDLLLPRNHRHRNCARHDWTLRIG
jgi:hypothetical protein